MAEFNTTLRAIDQLNNGVSKLEIDFAAVASELQSAVDDLRSKMTLAELKEYCAGPQTTDTWCTTCKHHDCVLYGTKVED